MRLEFDTYIAFGVSPSSAIDSLGWLGC